MNLVIGKKIVLEHPLDKLSTIGQVFEIARFVDDYVVIRDEKEKIAIATCKIVDFDFYFSDYEKKNTWTEWTRLNDSMGNIVAFYRTNMKKVQVRNVDNLFKGEATCYREDIFNLRFGLNLAYMRMSEKYLDYLKKVATEDYESQMKVYEEEHMNNMRNLKKMYKIAYPERKDGATEKVDEVV